MYAGIVQRLECSLAKAEMPVRFRLLAPIDINLCNTGFNFILYRGENMENKTQELLNGYFDTVCFESRCGRMVWDCYLAAKANAAEGLLDGFDIYFIHNDVRIPVRVSGHVVEYEIRELYELIDRYIFAKKNNLYEDPLWDFAINQSNESYRKNLGVNKA